MSSLKKFKQRTKAHQQQSLCEEEHQQYASSDDSKISSESQYDKPKRRFQKERPSLSKSRFSSSSTEDTPTTRLQFHTRHHSDGVFSNNSDQHLSSTTRTIGKTALTERQQLALLLKSTAGEHASKSSPPATDMPNKQVPRVQRRNLRGETPLHMASMKGDLKAANDLLELGAVVNAPDYAGWTALHEASNCGHTPLVELLLSKGADPNAQSTVDKDTPLHDAASNGHEVICQSLINAGADTSIVNSSGKTPLDVTDNQEIKNILTKGKSKHRKKARKRSKHLQSNEDNIKDIDNPVFTFPEITTDISNLPNTNLNVQMTPEMNEIRPRLDSFKNSMDTDESSNDEANDSSIISNTHKYSENSKLMRSRNIIEKKKKRHKMGKHNKSNIMKNKVSGLPGDMVDSDKSSDSEPSIARTNKSFFTSTQTSDIQPDKKLLHLQTKVKLETASNFSTISPILNPSLRTPPPSNINKRRRTRPPVLSPLTPLEDAAITQHLVDPPFIKPISDHTFKMTPIDGNSCEKMQSLFSTSITSPLLSSSTLFIRRPHKKIVTELSTDDPTPPDVSFAANFSTFQENEDVLPVEKTFNLYEDLSWLKKLPPCKRFRPVNHSNLVQRRLTDKSIPSILPINVESFLSYRQEYASDQIDINAPVRNIYNLPTDLQELFTVQEKERRTIIKCHLQEQEHIQITFEQELMRVYQRSTRSAPPISACNVFSLKPKLQQGLNAPLIPTVLTESNNQQYDSNLLKGLVQDLIDKFDNIKKNLSSRQKLSCETLFVKQNHDWELAVRKQTSDASDGIATQQPITS